MKNYSILLLIFLSVNTFAQKEISFSGFGATGFSIVDQNKLREYNQQFYYEGKLQADIKFNKDIEAQLDLRGHSEESRVIFREFSVKFEYLDKLKFKVGNIKKPFGLEQLVDREDLYTIDNSYMQNVISDFGYGGRSVSIMVYYNYKEKENDYPFSYYLALSKDNSLNTAVTLRAGYHVDNFAYAINYMFQNRGGEEKISSHGFAADISLNKKNLECGLEGFYVQDPIEGIIRRLADKDEVVFAGGGKFRAALNFPIGGRVIKSIEPIVLAGLYLPDFELSKYNTIEALFGSNFYFDKDVRLKLNADLLFTKNLFNTSYSTIGSRFIMEIQVLF